MTTIRPANPTRPDTNRRLSKRNSNPPPGAFRVEEAELDLWLNRFEPPTAEELAGTGRSFGGSPAGDHQ